MGLLYILVLSVGLFSSDVSSHPNGAPVSVCNTMTPGHGTKQTTASPYIIELSSTTLQNKTVTVTIKGSSNQNYQGFLLQARNTAGTIVQGTFALTGGDTLSKTMDCPGGTANSVTHTNTNAKTTSVFEWSAPSNYDVTADGLYFRATVAQAKITYWEDVRSESLTDGTQDSSTPPATTPVVKDNTTSKSPHTFDGVVALVLTLAGAMTLL